MFSINTKIISTVAILIGVNSFADTTRDVRSMSMPTDVGNGGWGIECTNKPGKLQLYDFYKFKNDFTPNIGPQSLRVKEKVKTLIDRVAKYSPGLEEVLRENAEHYFENHKFYSDRFLEMSDDRGDKFFFKNCQPPVLIMHQAEPELFSDSYYQGDEILYNRLLNNDHKAGLVFHEISYRVAREFGEWKNSRAVHPIVALVASDKMANGNVSEGEFLKYFYDLVNGNFRTSDSSTNTKYDLSLYHNGLLIDDIYVDAGKVHRGTVLSGSTNVCGHNVDISKSITYFFRSGRPSFIEVNVEKLRGKHFKCKNLDFRVSKNTSGKAHIYLDDSGQILRLDVHSSDFSGSINILGKNYGVNSQSRSTIVYELWHNKKKHVIKKSSIVNFYDADNIFYFSPKEAFSWEVNGRTVEVSEDHLVIFYPGSIIAGFQLKKGALFDNKNGGRSFCYPKTVVALDNQGRLLRDYDYLIDHNSDSCISEKEHLKRVSRDKQNADKNKKYRENAKKEKNRNSKNWQ